MTPEAEGSTLLLMRHGETEWNRQRRIMGDSDIPLSEAGRGQVLAAAGLCARLQVDRIVSSPMARAVETAAMIAEKTDISLTRDGRLQEIRFGRWQGSTYDEVAADPEYLAFAADPEHCRTAGGETITDVRTRALEAINASAGPGCTLVVTHGDVLRSLLCGYLGLPLAEYRRVRMDTAGLSGLRLSGGQAEVKFVNLLADPERALEPLHWGGGKG